MFICQHVVAVKQGLVTACLGKLVVRVNVDANRLVKLVAKQVVKVVVSQNQRRIEDQIILAP